MANIQFQSGAIDAPGAIGNAWELIKANYGIYLGVAVVAMIMTGCIPCINLFLIGPVMGGVYFFALRAMRNEPIEFGMMFKGFEKFLPLMIIGLLQSIPGVIAQILQYAGRFAQFGLGGRRGGNYEFFQSTGDSAIAGGLLIIIVIVGLVFFIVGIVWWAVFFFAIPLAMEHDLGPVEAIKLSAQAAMSNIGGMIVLLILQVLVALLGVLMCGIGVILVSIPVIYIANAFVYRQVFPYVDQQFNMTPPPPSAYGNFGSGMA